MVGIVIVSHSAKIAEGIKDLALQMAHDYDGIYAAGGMEDGSIGTDAVRIMDAIREADKGDGVVVFGDLGSGIISAEMAIDMLDGEGMYTHTKRKVLVCIVRKRHVSDMMRLLRGYPDTFTSFSKVNEVFGRFHK